MVTTIVLIRHAKPSVGTQTDDFSRPLSDEGKFIQVCMNRKLYQFGFRPSKILHSPLVRTTETARLLGECFHVDPEMETALSLDGDINILLSRILKGPRNNCLFFVGHGPSLMEFAERMTGHRILNGELEKSSALVLEFKDIIAFGKARFVKYYAPDETISSSQYPKHLGPLEQENLHFHIVIPSYNNADWCQRNLSSIASQTYSNWTATFINDCSTDDTLQIARSFVNQHHLKNKIHIVNNATRQLALANIYHEVHKVNPSWIIVNVDGDDWLAHDEVLKRLAEVYKDPKVWMTYGCFELWPSNTTENRNFFPGSPLPDWVLESNTFRSFPWLTSHLKTYYAGLFQKVKQKDLQITGQFYPMTSDLAFMFPMLEMASKEHIRYIPEILYCYNTINPLNDAKVGLELQQTLDRIIRMQNAYQPLLRTPHFVMKAHAQKSKHHLVRLKPLKKRH